MPGREPLDVFPLWVLFLATIAVVLLAVEGGFRLGQYRQRRLEHETETPVGAMVAAMLALLGFLLAFTFGLAASRYDAKRQVLLEEANAIGTTYLRAEMLPEPQRAESRKLLREYVEVRLQAAQPGQAEQALGRSEELHGLLWAQAVAVAEKDPKSIVIGLFIQALNEVIDLHSKHVMVALRSRIPVSIWGALYFVTILAMAGMGYHAGLTGKSRSLISIALVLTFSGVIWLIADIDRPQEGLLQVSQQAMIDLRNTMGEPKP
jgi:hypothetical protein